MTERKIYTKIVIDMNTDEVLEEESYDYSGPLALCDGEAAEEGGEDFEDFDEAEEPEEEEEEESEANEDEEEEEGEEDVTSMKQTIQQLQAKVEELSEMNQQSREESGEPDPFQYEDQTFIQSDDELDNVLNSSEGLNKLLNQANQMAIQHVQKAIPKVIQANVAQQIQLQETVSSFYSENDDLKPHRTFVGKVSERIMSEHPDWSMQKVLEETAKEARKRLKLKSKAESKTKKNPGFAKSRKTGKRPDSGKLKGREKEIADMLSATEK